ncbi:MAG: hypothetical protein LUH16_01560, partial [Clostridiales bacterium]|nr:hypothetical protein [Clostridiales bacterium]
MTNENRRPDEPGADSNVEIMREQIRSMMGAWETEAAEPLAPPASEPVPPDPEPETAEEPEPATSPEELPEEENEPGEEPSAPMGPPTAETPAKKPRRSLWELPVFRLFRRERPSPQEEPPQKQPPVSAYIPDGPADEDLSARADEGPELLTDILPPSHMRREEPPAAPEAVEPQPEPELPETAEEPEEELEP